MSRSRAALYRLLPTERPNPRARHIDLEPTIAVVRKMNREDRGVAPSVGRESVRIARGVEMLVRAFASGHKAILVGAGTSGRLGVLEAAECPPTFGTAPSMIQAVMAGGRGCVFRSREGAEDDAADGARQVLRRARPGDVVIGIAASGVTPFVRGALRAARRRGCGTLLITSNGRPAMSGARLIISPRVGPEFIAGSTRLKSGTAAKLVLNALTTASMIRLGRVYDRWMVGLNPASRKLRLRAARIVGELGNVGPARAKALLGLARGNIKIAVLAARLQRGSPRERTALAGRRLVSAGGSLRRALQELR